MSATSSSSEASTSFIVDIEAQNTSSGTATTSPSVPMPVLTHQIRTPSQVFSPIDPMDDFFGYTLSSTHNSRHDENNTEVPPPYAEESNLPEYTPYAEPVTLAMYLFKFGFLFPPFWIFGAFILFSPLREPPASSDSVPAWMPEKTEAERQQIIVEMRKVELKWARRSLYAFLIIVVLATAAGITSWALMRNSH